MCGIVGIFNTDKRPIDFNLLKCMSDTLQHRGPDHQSLVGFSLSDKKIVQVKGTQKNTARCHGGIGFNRLSILDLSKHASQPMVSRDRNVILAYNGETYNAFNFKQHLKEKGFRFKSKSDSEIILNLYHAFGIKKLLELINGMFAFCIVDLRSSRIYLARDHAGIKPLYWFKKGNSFLFASEMKAFYKHPLFMAELDLENINEYTLLGFTAHDRTLLRGVYQIPPAHFMEITQKKYKIKHYWTPELSDTNNLKNENCTSQLEQLLKITIKSQLRSDVRVGCQLSGGIDSSLVTTFARDYFKNRMDTFSIIPENKDFSEEAYIDEVIAKTRPHAHKIYVNPEYWVNNICSATYQVDAPVSFPHTIGIKKLAETAQGKVKVLLSGEGSDELMGGYREFFKFAHRKRHFHNILLASKMGFKGRKFQKHFLPEMNPENFFIRLRSSYFKKGLQVKADIDDTVFFKNLRQLMPSSKDPLKNIRVYDMRVRLPHLLAMQDRMTMASSIENRVPFLDREIMDFVYSMPSNQFITTGFNLFRYKSAQKHTKVLLKKVASLHYNKEFVYRKKMGFNQPLFDYLVYPRMREMVNDLILPGIKKRGLFNYSLLKKSHQKIGEASQPQSCGWLWRFLAFELWAQIFINRKAVY